MRHYWLNRAGNDRLILFFAGWGFDENPFKSLEWTNSDGLILYDYTDLALEVPQYKETHIIAWSMGVFIARDLQVNGKKIAINGTTCPVDDNFGIPKKVFDLTLKHAETGLQGKFYKNVFGADYERYLQNPVQRSIENRVVELEHLAKLAHNGEGYYDMAFVGMHDKIIPAQNQLAFWGKKAKPLDAGHFPFYNYSLNDFIEAKI
jgi:biotin synthesis protein BioG